MRGLKWNRYHNLIFLIPIDLALKSFTLCLRSRKWEYLSLITTQYFQNLSTDIAGIIKAKKSKTLGKQFPILEKVLLMLRNTRSNFKNS